MSFQNQITLEMQSGSPKTLGARSGEDGVNFAVFSENATQIDLCVFSQDGKTELARQPLPERSGAVWHGFVPNLGAGTLYGFRAHGSYAPEQGHRFNPNKLLMDPYTREFKGKWKNSPATLGYKRRSAREDLSFDTRDSARYVPKSIVSTPDLFDPTLGVSDRERLDHDWSRTLIYEAHPKGLTMEHPEVQKRIKGTYEALASDAVLEHLLKLGITAIELLPVHSFLDDGFLLEKSLRNYWGYNTIGFFAPEPRYFGPAGLHGFRSMVQKFHAAGIEVILDVVYNHTAEGDQRGPTLCYRGLDNASYYRLIAGQPRYYVNDTGTGNTVNVTHPYVLRMVMDSLRFWVQNMGIDGFRFDLATTLGRELHGFDPNGGFFDALRQDPVLSDVKMIAEPWDIGPGGYQVGEFPPEFAEWNDGYRDAVRRYWRCDAHSAQELAARLLGSAGQFDKAGRRAWSSVNLVTSHDGFTLADVTRYNDRHNQANGEDNRDGHHSNFSDNCGIEGETEDKDIRATRRRRQKNLLATMFLSQGTPMLLAGDELSNSQQGNNNAYCQDNPIGWVNWGKQDTEITDFVEALSAFRRDHESVRQTRFLHGALRASDHHPDVEWTDFSGTPMQWRDPGLSSICLTLRCSAEAPGFLPDSDVVFVVFNRDDAAAEVSLPLAPEGQHWIRQIDTSIMGNAVYCEVRNDVILVNGQSVVALVLKSNAVSA